MQSRVLSATSGECVRTVMGPATEVNSLAALFRDVVAACDRDGELRV
jgi:hypothetical protein